MSARTDRVARGPSPSAPFAALPSFVARPAKRRGISPLRPPFRWLLLPVAGRLQGFPGPGPRQLLRLPWP
eukprot:4348730-Alexandrium_andersonii.AAC.1